MSDQQNPFDVTPEDITGNTGSWTQDELLGVKPVAPEEQASIEEMAQKLRPLRAVVGGLDQLPPQRLFSPRKQAANYRTVKDGLEGLAKRTADVAAQAQILRAALIGNGGPDEVNEAASISPPGDDSPIFDQLAWEVLQTARLVAQIEEVVRLSNEAVK